MRLSAICQLGRARVPQCAVTEEREDTGWSAGVSEVSYKVVSSVSVTYIMHAMYMYNRSTTPWLGKLQISLSLSSQQICRDNKLFAFLTRPLLKVLV